MKSRRTWFGLAIAVPLVVLTIVLALARLGGPEAAKSPLGDPGPAGVKKTSAANNQIQLSHAESVRLVTWAKKLYACVKGLGIDIDEPIVFAREIDLRTRSDLPLARFVERVTECGNSLGGPPRKATLQTKPGKLVLYLPQRCLLDPKVTTRGARLS